MKSKIKTLPDYVKINERIRPQDDFYAYVCHHWRQDNPRPPTKSRWSLFSALNEDVEKQLEAILNCWLKAEPNSLEPARRHAADYYRALINKDENKPVSLKLFREQADQIAAATSKAAALARLNNLGVDAFFDLDVDLDSKDNERYCLSIDAASLDMPNRDYYLTKHGKMKLFRQAYLEFLKEQTELLTELGADTATEPQQVLETETFLAGASWPLHHARDLQKTYNFYTWEEFCKEFAFDWTSYFKAIGIPAGNDIIVAQPDCLRQTLAFIKELADADFKAYLLHKFVQAFSGLLCERLAEANFNFYSKTVLGVGTLKPLEKRAFEATNRAFCDVFGRQYVKLHFANDHKQAIEEMAALISQALDNRLAENSWMSPASKDKARAKLKEIIVNIGYSGHWKDYGGLDISADNPLRNYLEMAGLEKAASIKLLAAKPNRRRFGYTEEDVQTVNAWTNLVLLNTNYPAGFLQPPFYDHEACFEYNLGTLGSTIGHELTHNFDDNGARYDQQGHLNPWLSKAEQRKFKKAAGELIKRASKHYPTPKIRMNGKQVIGELIADLAGLEIVLDIIKQRYEDAEERREAIRRVFIAHAFCFATNESLEARVMVAKSGVHPDPPFRINGVVAHCADFYDAFNVKEGDLLYISPQERASIW